MSSEWGNVVSDFGVGGGRGLETGPALDPQCCWSRSVCCSRVAGPEDWDCVPSRHYSASSRGLWSCVVMADRMTPVAASWAFPAATADSQDNTLTTDTGWQQPTPPYRTPTRSWVHSSWTPGRTGSLQTQSSLLVTSTARAVTSSIVNITTTCRPHTSMDTACPATQPETPWDTPTTTSNAVPCHNSRYWQTSTTKL